MLIAEMLSFKDPFNSIFLTSVTFLYYSSFTKLILIEKHA